MPAASSPKPPMSEATREFGRRVRALRAGLGLSQERLAEGTALHWSYIGQIERGQSNLALHNVLKIALVLGVDPAELVQGLKPPSP